MNGQEAYTDAIEQLRPRFRAKMAENLDDMEDAFQSLLVVEDFQAELQKIVFIAHRVAGTASMFGWPDLGELARNVEERLSAFLAAPETTFEHLGLIEALLDAICEAVDA